MQAEQLSRGILGHLGHLDRDDHPATRLGRQAVPQGQIHAGIVRFSPGTFVMLNEIVIWKALDRVRSFECDATLTG